MAGRRPEEPVRFPMVTQHWRQVAFLHWPVAPDAIAAVLPAGLEPDLLEGTAWVGLTPFHVARSGPLGLTGPPAVTAFEETNLRTYVRRPDGRDGLWFLSLDVSSTLNAAGGRLIAAPYHLASMQVRADDGTEAVRYEARRRLGSPAEHDLVVVPGPSCDADADGLAQALAGRWRAFTRVAGRLLEVPVRHEPWPLREATLLRSHQTVTHAAGLELAPTPALVHWSPGVDAHLGPPRPARA